MKNNCMRRPCGVFAAENAIFSPRWGLREFTCYFEESDGIRPPVQQSIDVGLMVYDLFHTGRHRSHKKKTKIQMSLFHAVMENGIISIPPYDSPAVLKGMQPMLKAALYDYGVRQNLTQPPGFSGKTVKAYISLSEDDDHVSIYLGDKESVLCPDIGSLAQGRDKCNILVEKRSIVVPDAATEDGKLPAKSRFFLETLRSASEAEPRLKACVRALETPETIEKIREELDRMKIKPGDTVSFRVNGQSLLQSEKVRDWWKILSETVF